MINLTIASLIKKSCLEKADDVFLADENQSLTGEILWKNICSVVSWLDNKGLKKGDVVAFFCTSSVPHAVTFFACLVYGVVPCCLHVRETDERNRKNINFINAKYLFVDQSLFDQSHGLIEHNAIIGPFARLRPGADIGENVHIGNFVEIKNSTLANGVKANHLAYIGDTKVGEKANIGAGTITCNFDGYKKSMTEIGARAFIGSNAALVAPVKIGQDSTIGAGSVITKDVEEGALAITRAKQKMVDNYVKKLSATKVEK